MSATGEDQDYVDALLVTCGLSGCAKPPGEACVNSVTGEGPRELPHYNRVVRGRRANRGELADAARNGWIVARDGGRDCAACDQEIRRGEAYTYDPATDDLTHIHCP